MKLLGKSKRRETSRQRGMDDTQYVETRAFHGQEHYQVDHRHQHQHHDYHRQQHQAPLLTNEYEYVRREHGFDFMPPSRYVPSYSMSDDTDEYTNDPPIKIELPGSDLSESVEIEVEESYPKTKNTPVVQGKTIKVTSFSTRSAKNDKAVVKRFKKPYDELQARHRLQMKLVAEEFNQKNHRSPLYPSSPDALRPTNLPQYERQRGSGYVNNTKHRGNPANFASDVRTAYSYTSEDSRGIKTPKEARYNSMEAGRDESDMYRTREPVVPSPISPPHIPYRYGWTRSPRDIVVQDFSKPSHEKPPDAKKTPARVVDKPREHRTELHDRRDRRSHSREMREPPPNTYAEPPMDIEPYRYSRRRPHDREAALALDPYAEPAYYQKPREDPEYFYPGEDPANNKEKRKPKGIFGRFMSTVRGDKSTKKVMEAREWHNPEHYEGDQSVYGQRPGSFETDFTSYPPHRYDAVTGGVPYPFEVDEGYAHRRPRLMRKSLSPRQLPGRSQAEPSHRRRRTPTSGYAYDSSPERPVRPSAKAFHSAYAGAPFILASGHAKSEHRERAAGHHRDYPLQNHGAGARNKGRGHQSPGTLQFDGAQVRVKQHPKPQRNMLGCYQT